jgi:carbamoylphosphate synthase small subunit
VNNSSSHDRGVFLFQYSTRFKSVRTILTWEFNKSFFPEISDQMDSLKAKEKLNKASTSRGIIKESKKIRSEARKTQKKFEEEKFGVVLIESETSEEESDDESADNETKNNENEEEEEDLLMIDFGFKVCRVCLSPDKIIEMSTLFEPNRIKVFQDVVGIDVS